ncbi:MAG: hypothetical protein HON94_08935 [Methylococcales bacterium]|nr:hypothetical protein [Methylococcales bacterium]MBT7409077.1 hypothetical protein [Methylococcales bacterium]
MRRLALIPILICLLVVSLTSIADWKLAKNKNGITVSLRNKTNSDIKEFQGSIKIKASMDSILAAFLDVESCPKWFHQCTHPALINEIKLKERVLYHISDFPFPATDRYILSKMTLIQNPATKTMRINAIAVPDYCQSNNKASCQKIKTKSLVKIKHSTGYFEFSPLENGFVKVFWQHHTEPEGMLPKWMVNMLLVDIPYYTLDGLRQIVKTDKFKNAKFTYNAQGLVTGFE